MTEQWTHIILTALFQLVTSCNGHNKHSTALKWLNTAFVNAPEFNSHLRVGFTSQIIFHVADKGLQDTFESIGLNLWEWWGNKGITF